MKTSRLRIGRDVRVLRESAGDLHVEGQVRLRPGHVIELLRGDGAGRAESPTTMRVLTWAVAHLGSGGPVYRGRLHREDEMGTNYP